MGSKAPASIHWFRKGLRLHDNPALLEACRGTSELYPVFILDPWFVKHANVGANRWRFLRESLVDLDKSFRELKSRLFVVRGKPTEVLPELFQKWNITKLTYEIDTEPYSRQRDAEVETIAAKYGVTIETRVSHTLYDTEKVIAKNGGNPPLTYQRCQTVLSQMGPPAKPAQKLSQDLLKDVTTPILDDHDSKYGVPTLSEMGVDEGQCGPLLFPGGEAEALQRLERHLKKTNWICTFEKPKTSPNSLEPSTTVLSPYLKFGCLSVRTMYWRLKDILAKASKRSQPPASLDGQLLWREMFYTAGLGVENYDRMKGNRICKQIPWGENPEHLEAWKMGRTGFPFIDALMTQLRTEGWIHHLGRHSVACFLTRGDLWISWEEGMKVFEEYLLDADWSLNAGNWMWLSASSFFYQYMRVYSPIAFGKKTDKFGEYIKKYLPILKKMPSDYIYEPWKAPRSVQEKAGCVIGKDYPKPIVDHDAVRQRNIKRMAEAYAQNKAASEAEKKRKGSSDSEKKPKKSKK